MESEGCTQTHMSPSGLKAAYVIPRARTYTDPTGAVIQAWRGGGRWFTNLCRVESFNKSSLELRIDKTTCNQGGEGEVEGTQFWIENVLEELDAPNEFFFDENTSELY